MSSSPPLSPSAIEKADDHTHASPFSSAIKVDPHGGTIARWTHSLGSLRGFESRGIDRVPPSERYEETTAGYIYMSLLWVSANVSANNLAVGLLGPLVFKLGFVDSALCTVCGLIVGSIPPSYLSIWGPRSGNRALVGIQLHCV